MAKKRFTKLYAALEENLSRFNPEGFLHLTWGTWGLQQNDPVDAARRIIIHPQEAETAELTNQWAVYPWELETLTNMLFRTRQATEKAPLRTDHFMVMRTLADQLRALENVETRIYLDPENVLSELHRIAHRQFSWQSGFVNKADFYRYLFLYGQGECAAYFERTHGISV